MRNSNILKWGQNHKQDRTGNRNWIHAPDALQKGHIVYLVKFLGNTEVEQPKGIEVVKEGIRKLKFNHQLRKSEGSKTPKVELTISVDGVAIQEPKTKRIMHQYPLHRISYCADDKGEKKFFSFIAKESAENEQHSCFVFVSDKLAEEITLTIGQAFDLAYKRFLETSGRDLEVQRRLMVLQQGVNRLENENHVLRQRLSGVISGQIQDIEEYMRKNNISDMLEVCHPSEQPSATNSSNSTYVQDSNGTQGPVLLLNLSSNSLNNTNSSNLAPPPVPPRTFENNTFGENDFMSDVSTPAVGTKLEGLLMDELDDDFNPRANENVNSTTDKVFNNGNTSATVSPPPLLAPPPKPIARRTGPGKLGGLTQDMFGASLFTPSPLPQIHTGTSESLDPFGMADFCASSAEPTQADLETAIDLFDKKILEMKDGFSRGLSFGNEDFSLESLDPLRK